MVSEKNIQTGLDDVDPELLVNQVPTQNNKNSEKKLTDDVESTSDHKETIPVEMVEVPKIRFEELENAEAIALEEVKRERAGVINYRKRLEKQRDEFSEIASARVLSKLLDVEDDVNRIIDNGKEKIPTEHMEGIKLMAQRIKNIFDQEGVQILVVKEGKTRFDPRYHQAILTQPNEELADKTIITLVNAGFVKGDRVLRPAKVIITQKPVKTAKIEPGIGDEEESSIRENNNQENNTQASQESEVNN